MFLDLRDITGCSACKQDHFDLAFMPLAEPKVVKGITCEAYAICPVNFRTIYATNPVSRIAPIFDR